ncbi:MULTISPECIES: glycosyltransferase family 4 protein [unclassified Pseudomonas]|uniref:glycosyltransferase family 4 protein n=1 Tax=unclassified Pseudomonas TaxID=196821 RepID=UPI0004130BB4|nr:MULTISPECIES: glycosyltransferase family 4 protein [unclassified Pseudomonas]ATP49065.1 glycosyl transferase family 1 [Pseudomonas putida]MDE4536456.1 glycosyltransferase family 4 protein [Pseudomonas sp. ITEM 17296]SMF13965.1 Glycosyltransferase involved in cell wall bisynthesis [Pseudomonas sp. LAIL14HWK12:I11]SMR74820.1 Glycosyltransferase involved in cell wall bisynthesis [Pseudomonas sp. LAIL14HWK12:I10]SOD02483.1 Glycosyltransferase involved in cell wall bisynthesis [Pseudomonas sp. L
MKIIHLCVSCFYIDGYRYQENELVREHVSTGHDVLVVASTETYLDNLTLGYTVPGDYTGTDGARVIRLPYGGVGPFFLKKKLRIHAKVAQIIESFGPDVIMFHGLCGWELRTVARYKRKHPNVKLYVDSHEDANNSAVGKLSKILHRFYYRPLIRSALPDIDKVLCISQETLTFCRKQYGIEDRQMEFFPLGGNIADDATYSRLRSDTRAALGLDARQVVFLQSGKFDGKKKLAQSLRAFTQTRSEDFRFLIVGQLHDAVAEEVTALVAKDPRVIFLGWKSSDELYALLCAADVYVQPGSQSATMQMSLCARRPVIIADVPSHVPFVDGNGWAVRNDIDLTRAFAAIEDKPEILDTFSKRSHEIALSLLDYRRMAKRLLT